MSVECFVLVERAICWCLFSVGVINLVQLFCCIYILLSCIAAMGLMYSRWCASLVCLNHYKKKIED
jgi:hypothetical protein